MSRVSSFPALLLCIVAGPTAKGQCPLQRFAPQDADERRLGSAVDLDPERAIIAGHMSDERGTLRIWRRQVHDWSLELLAFSETTTEEFGADVAISGGLALAGAPKADDACTPDENCNSGAVYAYRLVGTEWQGPDRLLAATPRRGALFGTSLVIRGD